MPDILIPGYRCTRCNHEWAPRLKRRPMICAKCKSAYWDIAKPVSATMVRESRLP